MKKERKNKKKIWAMGNRCSVIGKQGRDKHDAVDKCQGHSCADSCSDQIEENVSKDKNTTTWMDLVVVNETGWFFQKV